MMQQMQENCTAGKILLLFLKLFHFFPSCEAKTLNFHIYLRNNVARFHVALTHAPTQENKHKPHRNTELFPNAAAAAASSSHSAALHHILHIPVITFI